MDALLTKRVRLIRPEFNPQLDGLPGTVVCVGTDPDTEGLLGVKLDKHYMTLEQAAECAEAADAFGRSFDARVVWCEPEQLEVTSC